jgi:hypothetical protein
MAILSASQVEVVWKSFLLSEGLNPARLLWISSATMATAISSGDTAPMSNPIGM